MTTTDFKREFDILRVQAAIAGAKNILAILDSIDTGKVSPLACAFLIAIIRVLLGGGTMDDARRKYEVRRGRSDAARRKWIACVKELEQHGLLPCP